MNTNYLNSSPNSRRRLFALVLALAVLISGLTYRGSTTYAQSRLPYKNPELSIDARVKDLLSRMSIEEKVAQMMCLWSDRPNDKSNTPKDMPFGGEFSPVLARQRMPYGIGQFARQREEH